MGVTDRLEFRLLGPVEVWHGTERLTISSRHQRSVLAALALRPGRVVPVSALVDTIWEQQPPPSAHRQVIKLVSRLRGTLHAPITTRASDYILNAEPDQIDVGIFDSAVAAARQLAATDPAGAATAIREALRLWRGPALSGVTPGLAAQATRLEECRLTALEDGIDWALATGGHAPLVAELTILVTEHPLRERLVGQLMLALHRSGRTSEALEVYRRTQQRLTDDLALAPGAQLQQLHLAILREDATPTMAPAPPPQAPWPGVAAPRPVPGTLPPLTGHAHHKLGNHQRAIAWYHTALELYQKLGARHPQADTLIRLGDTYQDAGDRDAAHRYWQQALPILEDLHHADADVLRARLAR